MVEKFIFWIESIVEDYPIPDEINIIVFKVLSNGNYQYLEMFGLEKEININKVYYIPLEAQFFNLYDILIKDNTIFKHRIKYIINEGFSSNILKREFIGRKLYLYMEDIEYLFTV